MLVRCVNRPFRDFEARTMRRVGDEWEATPERLAAINRAGYGIMVERAQDAACAADGTERTPMGGSAPRAPQNTPEEPDALGVLTVAELRKLCDAEGVSVPSKARKADIVAALEDVRGTV